MSKNKITLYINDETMEALDKVAQLDNYYKYPKEQAYDLIIDDLIRDVQKQSICSFVSCGCCTLPHSVRPSWCV